MDSELFSFGLRAVVTLFAVLDPLGNVPFYMTATEGMLAPQRRRVAWQASLAVQFVLDGLRQAAPSLLGVAGG